MTVEEFAQRIQNLKNFTTFSLMFRGELDDIFASILYYLANEQITDTAQARFVFADAIAELGSPLYGLVHQEVYNLWGDYSTTRGIHEGEYNLTVNALSYNFSTTDKGILLQNSNKSPNKELNFREKKYKGILGNGYQKFYVERILRVVRGTLRGEDISSMPILIKSLKTLNKKVKNYLNGGITT